MTETEIRLKFGLARYKDIKKGITDDNIEIIGYKEFRDFISDRKSLEEVKEEIKAILTSGWR